MPGPGGAPGVSSRAVAPSSLSDPGGELAAGRLAGEIIGRGTLAPAWVGGAGVGSAGLGSAAMEPSGAAVAGPQHGRVSERDAAVAGRYRRDRVTPGTRARLHLLPLLGWLCLLMLFYWEAHLGFVRSVCSLNITLDFLNSLISLQFIQIMVAINTV